MKKHYIYKITNNINGKIYVGKRSTIEKNLENDTYFGSGKILRLAIKKYGKENFTKEIIESCDTEIILNEREIYFISSINSFVPNGYNINIGGKGGDTFTHNPNKEYIKETALKNKGRKHSDEVKENKRIFMTGKKLKPHKKVDCEFCDKKISQANHNRFHGVYCKNNPNRIFKEITPKKECEFCNKYCSPQELGQFHGIYCKSNPNRIFKDFSLKNITEESYKKAQETKIKNGTNIMMEETKEKIRIGNTGKKRSEEAKLKYSESFTKRWSLATEIYKCDFCPFTTRVKLNLDKWHNENCKQKTQSIKQ